ncbi:hypothetical protein AB0D37_06870 [Streptomyces sp. NPDC048384]|uniref:hypothetical protein n=1 Tax=Streptomyces sp. NPDC048384 TaxID=3155487 RepID=UPI00343A4877
MAKKKRLEGTLVLVLKVKQTDDGPVPETLEGLKTWLYEEWDGTEAWFHDEELEEESTAELSIESMEDK